MTHAKLPNRIPKPVVRPLKLEQHQETRLAELLGEKLLQPEQADAFAYLIGCYDATRDGSRSTTTANIRMLLRRLLGKKRGRLYKEAVCAVAEPRSAIDHESHHVLQPLAVAVMEGREGADANLARAAREIETKCAQMRRVDPKTEALRQFCGWIRIIFEGLVRPEWNEQRHLHAFAKEMLDIAGVEHGFDAHPERLAEYLAIDISVL